MKRWLKWTLWAVGGTLALALLFLLSLGDPRLTLALLLSEQRPALLEDADWDDPTSAKAFGKRFHAGVPEAELVEWLGKKDFEVDRARRTADRSIEGLPCNEFIIVTWTAGRAGRLESATATVRQIACL